MVYQFSFTLFHSYSHFHTKSSLGCVLFTEEDYLPPKEADDVDIPETNLEELLEPPCPRCATVSYLPCCGLIFSLLLQKLEKKSNMNWMRCNKCDFRFCYRCKEPCFGHWHFNEYSCPRQSTIKEDIAYFNSLAVPDNDTEQKKI